MVVKEKRASEQAVDARVELKMRDAFGKVHYILALPKKKIEERLDDIWENLDTSLSYRPDFFVHINCRHTMAPVT